MIYFTSAVNIKSIKNPVKKKDGVNKYRRVPKGWETKISPFFVLCCFFSVKRKGG